MAAGILDETSPDAGHHRLIPSSERKRTIAIVETVEAVKNVEAIAATPGLDMIFVGSGDLRLSLKTAKSGCKLGANIDEDFDNAIRTILDACENNDTAAGIFTTSSEMARQMIGRG